MNKVSLPNDKRLQGMSACVCVRESVCACVVSPATYWLTGNKGHTEIVICRVRGHTEAEGLNWNWAVFVAMLCAPASSLLWVGKQRLSENEVTTYNLHPTGQSSFLGVKELKKSSLCAIWGGGSAMFSGMICSWCCLVSYADLFPVLRFLLLVWEQWPENNEHLPHVVLQSTVEMFCSLSRLHLSSALT